MKRCPECRRDYYDDTLLYCLDDGSAHLDGPASIDEPATAILSGSASRSPQEASTSAYIKTTAEPSRSQAVRQGMASKKLIAGLAAVVLLVSGGFVAYRYMSAPDTDERIRSIAVLPFQNRSDDPDTDYLSDGLAESLIFRLSQLPGLKVSPVSSVMRYKGVETDAAK